jgi:hypothetical protein
LKFLDRIWRSALVKHLVTVGADGSEIGDRVDIVRVADVRDWLKVMHVDDTVPDWSVDLLEGEPAHCTVMAPVLEARTPRPRVAFVAVHNDGGGSSLDESLGAR